MRVQKQLVTAIKTISLASTFALMVGMVGCSKPSTEEQATDTSSNTEATATTDTATEQPEEVVVEEQTADAGEKMQAYIACYNGVDGRAHDIMARYASWVSDMQAGPTGKEDLVYGLYDLSDHSVQQCQNEAQAAIALAPKMQALDDAAANYITALGEFDTITKEANKYYDRSDYKDDDFAKGKEMHPQLVTAFDNFNTASEAFGSQIDTVNAQLQAQQLQQIEQAEGKKFNYWLLSTVMDAKNLVTLIEQDSFDVEQAQQLLTKYENSSDELIKYINTKADDVPNVVIIDHDIESLLIAAKERIRRVRDNTAYNDAEINQINMNAGWMVEGSPDKVIKAYNSLIDASNRIN